MAAVYDIGGDINIIAGAFADRPSSGLKVGSKFFATDEGQWYLTTDDGTTWVNFSEPGASVIKVSLADDGSYSFPDASSGIAICRLGDDNNYRATFFWDTTANITLLEYGGSSYVKFTNADGYMCIIDGGTQLSIKNRLGSAQTLKMIRVV